MRCYFRTGVVFVVLCFAAVFFVLDPTRSAFFPQCPFYRLSGLYCPGCGSQRAIHSLLHLDFAGVVNHNLLFLPAALLLVYHYSYTWMNKIFGYGLPNLLYKKATPWAILGAILLFGLLRNLPWHPFSVLAPG